MGDDNQKKKIAFNVSGACTNKVSAQAIQFPSCLKFAYPTARTMDKLVMSITQFTAPKQISFLHNSKDHNKKPCTFFLKYNKINILFEKSCKYTCQLAQRFNLSQRINLIRQIYEEHEYTLNTEVNPSSQTAFENVFGSAPPVFGSNLLLTSAIKSQPLQTTRISDRLN